MMGWYGGMGPLDGLAMFVFWVALLGLIVWVVGRLLPGSNRPTTQTISPSSATQNTSMASPASGPIPPYQPIIGDSSFACTPHPSASRSPPLRRGSAGQVGVDFLEQVGVGQPHRGVLAVPALFPGLVDQDEAVPGQAGVHALADGSVFRGD